MDQEPFDLTLREASNAILDGSLSVQDLTESVLKRGDETEPFVNAYITRLKDDARRQAAIVDKEIANGRYRGPLHGIPFAFKDLYDTAGILTTGGSSFLTERIPEVDAVVVSKLKEAGIVLIGKLNMVEFAYGAVGTNPHYGTVCNPWMLDHVTGGSSSGSAAAIAVGSCLGTLGSDTGGSIRIPASLCGVVGMKPTYGRVSRRGVMPLSWTLDHVGPLARTVEDAAIVLNAIAGHDVADPGSADVPVEDFTRRIGQDIKGVHIAIPRNPFWINLNPEIARMCEVALDVFRDLGAIVDEVDLPIQKANPRLGVIANAEAAAYHMNQLRDHRDDYGQVVRARLETGMRIPATTYINAQRVRRQLIEEACEIFNRFDAIVSPTCPITAPGLDVADNAQDELIRLTAPYDITGIPAVSVPCGFDANGLPIGLMLGAAHFDEVNLLCIAHAFEQAVGLHARRPAF